MNSEKEALGRVVIATFEARRKNERALARAARMRLVFQIVTSLAVVAFAILIVRKNIVFSSQDWTFLICTLVTISGWSNYQLRETSAELKIEIDRLKAMVDDRKVEL
jgi:hypothetical protein